MFVDLEIIFNNSYSFVHFTYKVPKNLVQTIKVGDLVTVPFRNTSRNAVVVKINSNNSYNKEVKYISKRFGSINNVQLNYLQNIAVANNLNIGMLLFKYITYEDLSRQLINSKNKIMTYKNSHLSKYLNESNNIVIVSSLAEAKVLKLELENDGYSVSFYQKTGGVKEFTSYWSTIVNFKVIIVLSVNFEKIPITDRYRYHFYNSNNYSYNLPNLNNINVIESSIIKQRLFKGEFYYYSEFPSLDLFNKVKNYFIEVPDAEITYLHGNNINECLEIFDRKYKSQKLNIYTSIKDIAFLSKIHTVTNDKFQKDIDSVIFYNPTISFNGILSSNRLINFIKNLKYFHEKKVNIFVFSTKKIDLIKELTSGKITKWAEKEKYERSKFGPNINIKIFKIISNKELTLDKYVKYVIGPKVVEGQYVYELKIKINNNYNYNEIMELFSILNKSDIERVRSL